MAVYSRNPPDYCAAWFAYHFLKARVAEWIVFNLFIYSFFFAVLAAYLASPLASSS